MSNTIYVQIAGEKVPYTEREIRGMFDSQIKTLKKHLINREDSKIIDKWLEPKE